MPRRIYSDEKGAAISHKQPLFWPLDSFKDLDFVGSDVSGIAEAWGVPDANKIPVLLVVAPVLHLVLCGRWHKVLIKAKESHRIMPAGPPEDRDAFLALSRSAFVSQCIRENIGKPALNNMSILQLQHNLQKWFPWVIAGCKDALAGSDREHMLEEVESETLQVQKAIMLVSSLASAHPSVTQEVNSASKAVIVSGKKLIECVRASMLLRSRAALEESITRACKILFEEGPLEAYCTEVLSKKCSLPSASTLSRAQVQIDAAMVLAESDLMEDAPSMYWAFADSSPQLKQDIMLSLMLCIKDNDLKRCYEAGVELQELIWVVPLHDALADLSDEEMELFRRRSELAIILDSFMLWMPNTPITMTHGYSSLEDKLSGFLHTLWLKTKEPRYPNLLRLLPRFCRYFFSFHKADLMHGTFRHMFFLVQVSTGKDLFCFARSTAALRR